MLALADRFGEVAASVPGLAIAAHVPTESARIAIKILESPDPDSRTPDEDGRRIVRINGGWKIINHNKYRTLSGRDEEWQRERAKLKQKAYRDRERYRNAGNDTQKLPTVTTEAEAEAEAYKGLSPLSPAATRPEEYANEWNRLRGSLPRVQEFSESRRKKVKARIAQGITLDRFREAVVACTVKPHLRGDNGWTSDFDWLVKNDVNIENAINKPYGLNGHRPPSQPKPKILTGPPTMRYGDGGSL